jgi:hypothetical protein
VCGLIFALSRPLTKPTPDKTKNKINKRIINILQLFSAQPKINQNPQKILIKNGPKMPKTIKLHSNRSSKQKYIFL